MVKKVPLVALLCLVGLATVWAGGKSEKAAAKPAEPRPVVKIASNVGIPTIYKEGKTITGYEFELTKQAFDRMGYDVEVVDVAFAGIFAGLMAEKWDMCVSGIYVTKARVKEMDFTDPYLEGFDAVVARGNGDVQKAADLKGKKVAGEAGTSSAAFLAGLEKVNGPFETLGYDKKQTMFLDLENGRVQALSTGMIDFVKINKAEPGKFKVIATSSENYMIAGAVRPGDKIKDIFNKGLNAMKKDGTLAKMYTTYLGLQVPVDAKFMQVFTTPYEPTR
jgi:polar amino acid transport system substrate-binding protein